MPEPGSALRRLHPEALLLIGIALALVATPARATTTPGFALTRFDPAERGSDFFELDSLDLRGDRRLFLGFTGDYAYQPLVAYGVEDGREKFDLVRHQLVGHFGAAYVLSNRFRLGLDLPLAFATGDAGRIGDATFEAPTGLAAGDVRVSADARISGKYGQKLTTAAGVEAYVPTGSAADFAGDGRVRVSVHALLSGRVGAFEWAARAAFDYRALELKVDRGVVGSDASLATAAGFWLVDDRLFVEGELVGATHAGGDALLAIETPVELVAGARWAWSPDWQVDLGLARGLTGAFGEPALRVVGGLEWRPHTPPPDRDDDGIADDVDACPDEPGVEQRIAGRNGCPVHDRDGDGIADEDDACVDVPGIATSDPKTNGCADRDHDGVVDALDACPDVAGLVSEKGCPPDRDHDGVFDADDACPDVPGVRENKGCPADRDHDGVPDAADACPDVAGVAENRGCPADRDHDGVADAVDACPDAAGAKTNDPKTNGCPDRDHDGVVDVLDACPDVAGVAENHGCPPDRDHDSVPDAVDACPDEAGVASPDPKKNGCPVGKIIAGQIVLDQVKFKTDSDVILPESDATLTKVLDSILTLPDATRLRVEGHTDDQGRHAHNMDLSQRRARSVVRWMVRHGQSAKRFDAKGFGPDEPIDTNDTPEGRQNNRRVEFHLLP